MITDLAALAADAAPDIVTDITALVGCETHSRDLDALRAGLGLLRAITVERLGTPDSTEVFPGGGYGDTATLTYPGVAPGHVALIGHYDTVWPTGTLAGWPVAEIVDPDGRRRLTGPGIFDMKTGLIQGIWALKLLRDRGVPLPTVTFLFNGDEELGSPSSRPVIETTAAEVDASLVLEPSADGAIKSGRKGGGIFPVTVTGIESHAGLTPENGASAIHALAEFITAAVAVARPAAGTTVNVGLVSGGSGANVVAGSAAATVDIRVLSDVEQARVDAEFAAITVSDPRVQIEVGHQWNRPPMTLNRASGPLLDIARSVSAELGTELRDVTVGGGSDANFIAALGRPVLCGLGAVGYGAHARDEFIYPDTVAHQTALVAGILHRLTGGL